MRKEKDEEEEENLFYTFSLKKENVWRDVSPWSGWMRETILFLLLSFFPSQQLILFYLKSIICNLYIFLLIFIFLNIKILWKRERERKTESKKKTIFFARRFIKFLFFI